MMKPKSITIILLGLIFVIQSGAQTPGAFGISFCSQDKKHRVLKTWERQNGLNTYHCYQYDAQGWIASELSVYEDEGEDEPTYEKSIYTYDDQKRLTKLETLQGEKSDQNDKRRFYEYDSEGRLTKYHCDTWNIDQNTWELFNMQEYSYDGGHLKTAIELIPGADRKPFKDLQVTYQYDAAGRISQISHVKLLTQIEYQKISISYDASGRVEKIHTLLKDQSSGETISDGNDLLKYDERGNLSTFDSPDFSFAYTYNQDVKAKDIYYPADVINRQITGSYTDCFFLGLYPYSIGSTDQLRSIKLTKMSGETYDDLLWEVEYEKTPPLSISRPTHEEHIVSVCSGIRSITIIASPETIGRAFEVYNIKGEKVETGTLRQDFTVLAIPSSGVYVVKVGNQTSKVIVG